MEEERRELDSAAFPSQLFDAGRHGMVDVQDGRKVGWFDRRCPFLRSSNNITVQSIEPTIENQYNELSSTSKCIDVANPFYSNPDDFGRLLEWTRARS